jgi:uncharacterized protein (TIGR00288 family)
MSDKIISENIAVYVDGDNANHKDFCYIYEEIKKYGRIIIGRIYGDWSKTEIKGWREISINYAFESVNCISLSKKNSTDIYLICDILKDLYNNNNINTFIIVSSDSDYSHVTKRIRSEGKKVFGFGSKNTPNMLKNSCDIFISNEVLKNIDDEENNILSNKLLYLSEDNNELRYIFTSFKGRKKIDIIELKKNLSDIYDTKKKFSSDTYRYFEKYIESKYPNYFRFIEINKSIHIVIIADLIDTIKSTIENMNNTINLSVIKEKLLLKDPSFDQRSYGYKYMHEFIENLFPEIQIIKKNNGIFINSVL